MNFETYSGNIITMDEFVKDATITDKQNEESVESKVIPEKEIISPEDMYADKIAHPEVNKDQDAVATAYPEGP